MKSKLITSILLALLIVNVYGCSNKETKKQVVNNNAEVKTTKINSDNNYHSFWKDKNTFTAKLKRLDGESFVTKDCVGVITETSKNTYNIKINCEYNEYFNNLNLGDYKVEDNRITKNNIIIWSSKKIKDSLNEEEKGVHNYIVIADDIVKSIYYDNSVETGYYENIELSNTSDKSLLSFKSGFGADRDLIEITDIKSNEKDSTKKSNKISLNIKNNNLLKVLKNEEKLYCIQSGEEMFLNEYNYSDFMTVNEEGEYEYDSSKPEECNDFEIGWISIVDMDQDGIDEIVLYEKTYGIRIILRYFKDKVYLYSFPFRQMKIISTKGEFTGSGSAVTSYVGKIKFEELNCYYVQTCLMDLYQKKGNRYKIGNKKVSKKEAEEYLINSTKELIKEYEYNTVIFN